MTNNTTPQYHSYIAKMTYTKKAASRVPNFAARWCSKRNISSILNKQPRTTMQDTTENERKHHTPIIKEKEFKPTKSKLLLFSFLLKNNTNTSKLRSSRGKKNRGSLKANF